MKTALLPILLATLANTISATAQDVVPKAGDANVSTISQPTRQTYSKGDLSTSGWRLWPDAEAQWKKQKVFLPDETDLSRMPVNPPTGGWDVLREDQGIPVTLPSSVEEHFWGKFGLRPYTGGEYLAGEHDPEAKCGVYQGVSWWWRSFEAPAISPGKRLVISFRAARLVAEVYVNGKLCGYSIFANLPFEADITKAIKPGGKNQLAIRIINPGGRFDWPEGDAEINGQRMNAGRGFGGLDADIQMRVRDQVEVSDLAVLNKAEPRSVSVLVEVKSSGAAYEGPVDLAITRNGKSCWRGTVEVKVPAGSCGSAKTEVSLPDAELWTLENPALYQASASLPKFSDSGKQTPFGFRWFTAEGIATAAPKLVFNGKRMVLRSAICWGFWGKNGLFPDDALAEKEVKAAKALGLNCLNFHREIGRTVVMDAQDRMGLLRYEEPGTALGEFSAHNPSSPSNDESTKGTIDTSGKGGETPTSWYERYCTEKTLHMVKRDRSHPCLVIYSLSNETAPNFKNPRMFAFMRKMHELDPSRILLVKSGNSYKNQCFLLPYDSNFRYDDGTGYSGWFDQHGECLRVNGNWQDIAYQGPTAFAFSRVAKQNYDPREIVAWGEAQITAIPDNHAKIVADYRATGQGGYDRADHERILAAYEKFLDDYGFRPDFKTASDLFETIGYKGYFAFQKSIEHMRMVNKTDFIALNGWESTTVENHSGLVDVHRNFKGDPEIIRQACAPERLVVRPRHYVTEPGQPEIVDVHLINEVNRHGLHTLNFKAVDASGVTLFETNRTVNVTGGDTFGELLTEGIEFVPSATGTIKLEVSITPQAGGSALKNVEEMFVVPSKKIEAGKQIAVAGNVPSLAQSVRQKTGIAPVALGAAANPLDAVVLSYRSDRKIERWGGGADDAASGERKLLMYDWAWIGTGAGTNGEFTRYTGLAHGACQVELHFVEPRDTKEADAAGRIFDVVINGNSVLTNLNVFAQAGGKQKLLVRRFTVDAPEGVVSIALKAHGKQPPVVSAIKLTDAAGKIIREYAGPKPWLDKSGATWQPLVPRTQALNEIVAAALKQVRNHGARLVIVPENAAGTLMLAAALGDAGVWKFNGSVGPADAIWMGSWYFVRKHWLFDGLPTGCSMDWHYQVPVSENADGLLLSVPGLEVAAGYGRDHRAEIGIGAGVAPCGKGQVVFFSLPGMASALNGKPDGMACPVATRLLLNSLSAKP